MQEGRVSFLKLYPHCFLSLSRSQVSRFLCDTIESSAILQYKIELAIAGMVDVTRRDIPYSERLESLQAYRHAWRLTADPTFVSLLRFKDRQGKWRDPLLLWWPSSGGVFPFNSGTAIGLYRPPSISRRIPERSWSISPVDIPLRRPPWCTVDMAQDLLILINPDGRERYVSSSEDISSISYANL